MKSIPKVQIIAFVTASRTSPLLKNIYSAETLIQQPQEGPFLNKVGPGYLPTSSNAKTMSPDFHFLTHLKKKKYLGVRGACHCFKKNPELF
jgi:hypothetical protein